MASTFETFASGPPEAEASPPNAGAESTFGDLTVRSVALVEAEVARLKERGQREDLKRVLETAAIRKLAPSFSIETLVVAAKDKQAARDAQETSGVELPEEALIAG